MFFCICFYVVLYLLQLILCTNIFCLKIILVLKFDDVKLMCGEDLNKKRTVTTLQQCSLV